jgi:hypothetical protein
MIPTMAAWRQSTDQDLPMRNTFVPHFGHTPRVAGLPFFSVTFWGFFISTLDLHLKQYACIRVTSFQSGCTITAI